MTYFAAELECPECGARAPADESTDILTSLLSESYAVLREGDHDPRLNWQAVSYWYPVLREPEPGEPITVLETWTCPNCGARSWVRITLADGTVQRIEAVPLTAAAVRAAHAITNEIEEVYRALTDWQNLFGDGPRTGFRDRLLDVLDAAEAPGGPGIPRLEA